MFKLLEDLRFVVGSFFGILSIILVSVGYVDPITSTVGGTNMNLMAGWTMFVFASFMLTWSILSFRKEGNS